MTILLNMLLDSVYILLRIVQEATRCLVRFLCVPALVPICIGLAACWFKPGGGSSTLQIFSGRTVSNHSAGCLGK